MILLLGVRSCGRQRGLGSRFWACMQLMVRFWFLSLFELNRILIVVFGRPHFRSRVEFCGLCSSLTFGSSPRISGYDGVLHPRMVDIFVLEHCYAAAPAVEPSSFKVEGGGKKYTLHFMS